MRTESQNPRLPGASTSSHHDTEWTRGERTWIGIVSLLFSSTGSLKLYAGLTGAGIREAAEKVFQLPMTEWSLAVGTLELIWVVLLVASPGPGVALRIVRFLFSAILAYRTLFHAFDGGYCGCLGGLLSDTPWQSQEGLVLGSVAVAGLVVNEGLLALWRHRQSGVRRVASGRSVDLMMTHLRASDGNQSADRT
ncbi:MAG: hypothetical protein JNK85_25130 [Verrucomicrobiales bacterium]|nr:hypothetical protein [Verrucomicrobiales bacterium]